MLTADDQKDRKNSAQCPVARASYLDEIGGFPLEYLVFLGKFDFDCHPTHRNFLTACTYSSLLCGSVPKQTKQVSPSEPTFATKHGPATVAAQLEFPRLFKPVKYQSSRQFSGWFA